MDKSLIEEILRAMDPFAVLNVTPFCDQTCVFCSEGEREPHPAPSTDTVKEMIEGLIAEQQIRCVLFMGGEVTLRRDFLELARFVKSKGLRLQIATNGQRFADASFARAALEHIDGMEVSFHAHDRALFQAITGRDRFDQLLQALRNLCTLKPKLQLTFNVVINALNHRHLLPITQVLAALDLPAVATVHYKYIKISGRVLGEKDLVVSYAELQPSLRAALQYCVDRDLHFLFEGVPYCIVPEYLAGAADAVGGRFDAKFYAMNRSTLTGDEDPADYAQSNAPRHYPPPCARCELKGACPGIRTDYQEMFGHGEVAALSV